MLAGDARGDRARAAIDAKRRPVLASTVCVWEAAIKSSLGKLEVSADLPGELDAYSFERLSITETHAWKVRDLPLIHSDPFDRMIAAQAICEGADIVSPDAIFDRYGITRIW